MKNRIYPISLALIVLAFLSSCNGDPLLVGKSKKQTFEVSYDIEIDVKESLLSMKNNYDKASSVTSGTYGAEKFREEFDLYEISFVKEIGDIYNFKNVSEVSFGLTKFEKGEKALLSFGNNVYIEEVAFSINNTNVFGFMPLSLLELLYYPYITVDGKKFEVEDFPVAQITGIEGVKWSGGKNVVNYHPFAPEVLTATFHEDKPGNFLAIEFANEPEFFFIKKTYKKSGNPVKVVYEVSNPESIDSFENGALGIHILKETDGLTRKDDFDFIECNVFMLGKDDNYYRRDIYININDNIVD